MWVMGFQPNCINRLKLINKNWGDTTRYNFEFFDYIITIPLL